MKAPHLDTKRVVDLCRRRYWSHPQDGVGIVIFGHCNPIRRGERTEALPPATRCLAAVSTFRRRGPGRAVTSHAVRVRGATVGGGAHASQRRGCCVWRGCTVFGWVRATCGSLHCHDRRSGHHLPSLDGVRRTQRHRGGDRCVGQTRRCGSPLRGNLGSRLGDDRRGPSRIAVDVAITTEQVRAAGISQQASRRAWSRGAVSWCRRTHSARTIASASSIAVSASASEITLLTSSTGCSPPPGPRG